MLKRGDGPFILVAVGSCDKLRTGPYRPLGTVSLPIVIVSFPFCIGPFVFLLLFLFSFSHVAIYWKRRLKNRAPPIIYELGIAVQRILGYPF